MTAPRPTSTVEQSTAADPADRSAADVTAAGYTAGVQSVLADALRAELPAVRRAAELVARAFAAEGLFYVFGSGHSHMFGEEAFYRAGGAVRVCPILKPAHMLHEGAVHSTVLERQSGHAEPLLDGYRLDPARDVMLVVSNSGANAFPVEVAQAVKARGLPLIAITSRRYASSIERSGPRLHDIADVVIDNHCPPGDALVPLGPGLPSAGPASTVVGMTLLDAIIVEAFGIQLRRGETPEVFMSANMPGAAEHNAASARRLSHLVPHL
ncbi:SIS domain-containing protein [Micromonospora sp. WMMD882]|uniref:SIS domain-containing protein n=1 Tax=Micromonospora sp. WMMD882 TaxID=3015151 RepID=UPI00248C29F8|nr:SIS domain-containing protein [Micromonospora sp. WMMD882]WBB80339.1 SIS domain-containing protein [Micromonospora sp. WMMD882]